MGLTASRTELIQHGERLEYFTIFWNTIEGLLSVGAGIAAGSIALVGFGLDSFIEVTSGAALLWRMKSDRNPEQRERAERLSLKIVGFCFLALAAYVAIDSVHSLSQRTAPEPSVLGITIGVASLFVMPLLARAKRRVGKAIDSPARCGFSANAILHLSFDHIGGRTAVELLFRLVVVRFCGSPCHVADYRERRN